MHLQAVIYPLYTGVRHNIPGKLIFLVPFALT